MLRIQIENMDGTPTNLGFSVVLTQCPYCNQKDSVTSSEAARFVIKNRGYFICTCQSCKNRYEVELKRPIHRLVEIYDTDS